MNRRLASLLVLTGILLGAGVPSSARAQAPRAKAPVVVPTPAPPAPPAYEYTFVKREGPDEDLVELQRLGAEGWKVVATVIVEGSTRRYVLMREKRPEPAAH